MVGGASNEQRGNTKDFIYRGLQHLALGTSLNTVFLQDQNFWGSFMTPCLKIWGSLANLEGQNFFNV